MSSQSKYGILDQMPAEIAYMKMAGVAANAVHPEEVDGNETLTKKIEAIFRKHFARIPKSEGLKKLKEDERTLEEWLKLHPHSSYPETLGLYVVVGMLTYLDYIYD